MDARDYQREAKTTVTYPEFMSISYVTLGLAGEAGEVANKVKKVFRDHGGVFEGKVADAIGDKIGDVLWYCAMLCEELDLNLADVMQHNIDKLRARRDHGTLKGDGDQR